jgi:hypothetical protein
MRKNHVTIDKYDNYTAVMFYITLLVIENSHNTDNAQNAIVHWKRLNEPTHT